MKIETLKALKSSIAHWKRMRRSRKCGERPTYIHCALCYRFNACVCETANEKCPVYESTRQRGCAGSPFLKAYDIFDDGSTEAWKLAASDEIKFLESLLPKKKGK